MREKDRLALLRQPTMASAMAQETSVKKKLRADGTAEKGSFDERLQQAGIFIPAKFYIAIVFVISCWLGFLASILGKLLAVFVMVSAAQYLLVGYLEERGNKRKKKIIPQLAPFIDGIASALS